ncbi:MAG: InlB B-repeat-containing protein [Bacteroidales bacterium]|nr:InlB B-repeat-containing protein [Bacteroidales bacterium]
MTWSEQGLLNASNVNDQSFNVGEYFSVTCTKNGAQNNPTYYNSSNSVRCYATKNTNTGNIITVRTNEAGVTAGVYILSVEYAGTHNKQGKTSFIYSGETTSTTTTTATYSEDSKTQTASATLCETGGNKNGIFYFESITITYNFNTPSPTITLSETELNGFTYIGQGPSAAQEFTLQGSNLTEGVTLSATGNYEISKTLEGEYSARLDYTTAEIAEAQKVYVRLKAGLQAGNYEGTITATSTDADNKTITLSGEVSQAFHLTFSAENGIVSAADANGAPITNGSAVATGTTVTLTATADEGYRFLSWAVENNVVSINDNNTFIMPTSDVNITANFEPRTPKTVTLHHGIGGNTTTPVTKYDDSTLGEFVKEQQAESVNGWSFAGWVKSYTSGTPSYINETELVGETNDLYALYSKGTNTFELINDEAALEVGGVYMICGEYNNSFYSMNEPTDNYMGATEVNTIENNQFEYNVGKKFVLGVEADAYTFADGDYYLSATEAQNYLGLSQELTDFSKWSISFSSSVANISNVGNNSNTNKIISYYNQKFNCYKTPNTLYLYKQITDKEYSTTPNAEKCHVTYDANGGSNPPTDPTEYAIGATVTVLGPGEMSREGHTFMWWSNMQNWEDNGAEIYGEGETFTISENTTLYAQWTTNSYSFVLNTSGNVLASLYVDGTKLQDNDKIQFDKEVTIKVMVNDGYTYSVSVTNNTTQEYVEVIDNMFTMPASDITVTVTATALQNYTITYYVNGVVATTQNVIEGSAAALPTEDDITVPEGFNFVGWTENEETAELIPQPFIPTGNTNLYLVFENTYYEKVKTLNDITAGTYIIVNADYCLPNSTTTSSPVKNDEYKVTGASSTDRYYPVPNNTEWTFTGTNKTMTIKNSDGEYLYATKSNTGLRVNTTPDTWAFEENGTGFAMKDKNNSRYCATYEDGGDWRSYTSKDADNYADGGVLYLFKKSLYTRVYDASTTTQMENIPSTAIVTVPNGVVFTLTGTNKGSSNNLIIEDGGQLIVNDSGVMATFKKSIEATPTAKTTEGGWYSIASPVNNVAISSVTNLVDNADHSLRYNLYRYNETRSKWEAYNTTEHPDFTTLAKGQGYLYRNNGMELSFSGEVNHGDVVVNLTNNATNNELKGFNLIGNPFGHNIYKGSGAAIDNNNLSEGFYYLTYNGEWQAGDGSKAITPQMGVLVQVTGEASEVTLTISDKNNSPTNTRYANDNLQFIVSNNEYQDVAYAKFSKGHGLNKISHRNSEVPMLYIPQNGERYAIAMMSDNTEMFALNFKAATMGRYTLSYKAEGEFSYLHVIDRLTGDDVDMLLEGEYSFTASPKDNESRFIVRLAYKPDYSNEGNEMFVYQNGDEILVSGEGELQVFDATGRLVRNMSINGAKSLNISTQGVYIFRLVGNEVKTQKIVVR